MKLVFFILAGLNLLLLGYNIVSLHQSRERQAIQPYPQTVYVIPILNLKP